jgi:hypothetical protein
MRWARRDSGATVKRDGKNATFRVSLLEDDEAIENQRRLGVVARRRLCLRDGRRAENSVAKREHTRALRGGAHARTRTHASGATRTRRNARTRTDEHLHLRMHARTPLHTLACKYARAHTRTHTDTHADTHTERERERRTRTHARTHARTHRSYSLTA